VVVEIEAPPAGPIDLEARGRRVTFALAEALQGARVETFTEKSRSLTTDTFDLDPPDVPDPERIDFVAPPLKIARAAPRESYETEVTFRDPDPLPGEHHYCVRLFETTGDGAWSSPIWLRVP
jgi:hypothetical protein